MYRLINGCKCLQSRNIFPKHISEYQTSLSMAIVLLQHMRRIFVIARLLDYSYNLLHRKAFVCNDTSRCRLGRDSFPSSFRTIELFEEVYSPERKQTRGAVTNSTEVDMKRELLHITIIQPW